MEEKYIIIMIESLQKKLTVLDHISQKNDEQTKILNEEQTDWEAFDRNADEKSELIEQLDQIDEGFELLFEKIKSAIASETGKSRYKKQIEQMQDLIERITEKSVSIQAVEVRNKQMVEKRFMQSHQKFGFSRNSSRIARDYYKNMQQTQVVTPAFLDSKK